LDRCGLVLSSSYSSRKDSEKLEHGLSLLDRAFRIRFEKLGPTHVDTVETLNKIARIQMKQKNFTEARDSYYEVLKLREAIFGDGHPCVAISAQALASAHTRLFQVKSANFYFNLALKVYEENGLGKHPFAETIRKDLYDLKFIQTRFEV
jgi:tetratricopeptide (TPR) repeat protein